MISVLIPVYNYSISSLVNVLHEQLTAQPIPFEILCLDDGSDVHFTAENSEINTLEHTQFMVANQNNGRTKTRQLLCDKAQYNWLLFLDADVIPKNDDFVKRYLETMAKGHDAVFGGFTYDENPPETNRMLRWSYGRKKEVVDAKIRNKNPYKIIISANFLIRKAVFKSLNSEMKGHRYGQDNYFGALLKSQSTPILHVDNEVIHLGIETSEVYLKKIEQAVETLLDLYNDNKITVHNNDLLKLFQHLKKYQLHYAFTSFYKTCNSKMRKNLLGTHPNITYLQLYKTSYMCYLDANKS